MPKINLEHISIVVSRPQYDGNIGSLARAMRNMGLARLRVAAPQADLHSAEALKMACDAQDVLMNANVYGTLLEALADIQIVVGTTRRVGVVRQHVLTPRALAAKFVDVSQAAEIAIVFGNEGTGLSNEEIALCQWLVTIPTAPSYKSINLAQAVMVIAYEIFVINTDMPPEPVLDLAPAAAVEPMYQALRDSLLEIGFLDPNNPERLMFALRRFLGRAKLEARDVRILRGIARQIKWYANSNRGSK
ncbi:MAG: RNA methyltransferase [Acidobacteria bacterium]|nr:RNA methyltransferase [Acidobacteriota bacterium]MBI3656295.1 RNA methyltransferase [Acidobacteriota bacterium]